MQVYHFKSGAGRSIEMFESSGVKIVPILRADGELNVACFYLDADGLIGNHKAPSDQLLLVVQGSAFVKGDDLQIVTVEPGCAVFWRQGEMHETRAAAEGLTAIIIEGSQIKLEEILRMKTVDFP